MTLVPRLAACLALLALAFGAMGAGCDLFRPADPEPPAEGATFVPDYSQPDSTLATIAKAIADKGSKIGSGAYAGAFAESVTAGAIAGFHQTFWPEDAAQHVQSGGTVPADWGFVLEQNFYPRFIHLRNDAYHLEWTPDNDNPDIHGTDEEILNRHYLVTSHAMDGTRTSVLAIGFARLRMLRFPDGAWRIVRWDDRRDPDRDLNDPNQVTLGRRRLATVQ